MYFDGVEEGSIPDHGHHISHTTEGLIDSDGTDLVLSILFLDFLKFSLLFGDDFLDLSLKGAGESVVGVSRNASVLSSGLVEESKEDEYLQQLW